MRLYLLVREKDGPLRDVRVFDTEGCEDAFEERDAVRGCADLDATVIFAEDFRDLISAAPAWFEDAA